MYIYVSVLMYCLLITAPCCFGKTPVDCPGDQNLYKELKCNPVFADGPCPIRYDCPNLSLMDKNKCHLSNLVTFNVDDRVPEEMTKKFCAPSCICSKYGDRAKLNCAHYDCAEFFGPRNPDCINIYEIDSCCATGKVCGDDKKKLSKCYVEGKEYYEGQKIYPESAPCTKCLCKAGFDNSTILGNPACKEIECGAYLHYADKLAEGCIPIYHGHNKCCPIEYKCPDAAKDEVISQKRSTEGKHFCTFGTLKLFVGDELKKLKSENNVSCQCLTPPFIDCIHEQRAN